MALGSRRPSGRLWFVVLCVPLLLAGCTSAPPTAKSVARLAAAPQPFVRADDVDPVCHDTLHGINLQDATIKDLQDALAAGRITSVQLVQAYLARIEAFDRNGPKLN